MLKKLTKFISLTIAGILLISGSALGLGTYQSLSLNGSGYASIADGSQAGLNMGLSDFMIEGWVKTSNTGVIQYFMTKRTTSGYYLRTDANDHIFGVVNSAVVVASNFPVSDGQWHYIVFVVDKSSATGLKLFVDGVECSYSSQQDPTAIGNVDSADDFAIGRFLSWYFTGLLDEMRVWNFGYGGLPADWATYVPWRYTHPHTALSSYDSNAWAGYADAVRTELLTNGDMEAANSWTNRGTPGTNAQSNEQFHGGANSRKIVTDVISEGAYQDIVTVVGAWYEVRGWVYVTAGDAKIGKEDTDGSDQVLTSQATAGAWNEFAVIFQATETTSRIFFQSDATAISTFYADDISVKRIGLVARYKFDGDYLDQTSNSNDLTAGGAGNAWDQGYTKTVVSEGVVIEGAIIGE